MIVSKKALSYLIPRINEINDDQIIKAFNNSGCEVERVIKHNKVNNLVIGKILKIERHPNADKLNVCTVLLDDNNTQHTIVCGATNLVVGKYVIVALQGAKTVDGREIQYKELRGVLSQGMICAYSELTNFVDFLSQSDSNGVILLDDAKLGDTDPLKYINLEDTIYDLSLPSNRNDLNSVYSICQELNGYFDLGFINDKKQPNLKIESLLNVSIDKNICSSATFLQVKNVSVAESSWQIKSFLMNNGIIPVNNLVDRLAIISLFTNISIVAYDYEKVGTSLSIQKNSEQVSSLICGKKIELNNNDIIIKNKNNIIGLAGICPFDEFKVSSSTKNALIEIGNYDFRSIRTSMVRLNLSSENGKRLTKPLSNWYISKALSSFTNVFENAEITTVFLDLKIEEERKIAIDFNEANAFLGINEIQDNIKKSLNKYGYDFDGNNIVVPGYRLDVQIYQDVYEEILKIADIDKIKGSSIKTEIVLNDHNIEFNKIDEIRKLMNSNYFTETRSYNLVNKQSLDQFNVFHVTDSVKIANPLNSNHEYMRSNLIESLLDVYQFNLSYKNNLQPIFEIQKIYYSNKSEWNLTGLTFSNLVLDKVNKSKIVYNVDSLKSITNSVANIFNATFDYFPIKSSDVFYADETLAIYCSGQLIGYIGRIKDSKVNKYGLNGKEIYTFTINLNLLFNMYHPSSYKVEYKSNLMPVYKDISYVSTINSNTTNVIEELKKLHFIDRFEYIDIYQIEGNKYSYTLRVYFKNNKKYSSEEIDQYIKELQHALITEHCEGRK